jgi:replicative DNA helicase
MSEKKPYDTEYYYEDKFDEKIEFFRRFERRKTGFDDLDRELTFSPGLIVLGAISSLGKTTFALQIACQMAKLGEDILFFSLEQSRFELMTKNLSRLIAQQSQNEKGEPQRKVPATRIRAGNWSDDVARYIYDAKAEYKGFGYNLSVIDADDIIDLKKIEAIVEDHIKQNETAPIVIIDYLQIIKAPSGYYGTDKQRIDVIVETLKQMQKKHNLTLLLISSINRAAYLAPLDFESFKESGIIEFSSDVVLGLQLEVIHTLGESDDSKTEKRDAIINAKSQIPRQVELICLKNRNGASGWTIYFDYFPNADIYIPRSNRTIFDGEEI